MLAKNIGVRFRTPISHYRTMIIIEWLLLVNLFFSKRFHIIANKKAMKHSENYNRFFISIYRAHSIISEIIKHTDSYNYEDRHNLKYYVAHLNMIDVELMQLLQAYDDSI